MHTAEALNLAALLEWYSRADRLAHFADIQCTLNQLGHLWTQRGVRGEPERWTCTDNPGDQARHTLGIELELCCQLV